MMSNLDFLVGDWKGKTQGFGDDPADQTLSLDHELSEEVISGKWETTRGTELVNRGTMAIIYDKNLRKFVWKQVFSYGFIINKVGGWTIDRFVFDAQSIDGEPEIFKNTRVRYSLEKISMDEFVLSLLLAKKDSVFEHFGHVRHKRVVHSVND